jgi:hypothetical protein
VVFGGTGFSERTGFIVADTGEGEEREEARYGPTFSLMTARRKDNRERLSIIES